MNDDNPMDFWKGLAIAIPVGLAMWAAIIALVWWVAR